MAINTPTSKVWTPERIHSLEKFGGLSVDVPTDIKQKGRVIIVYGPGGVGKTSMLLQLVDSAYVSRGIAHLDMDAGHESIQDAIDEGKISHFTIRSWPEAKAWQDAYVREQPWDVVCVDNVSELQVLNISHLDPGNVVHDIQYYNGSQAQMMQYVRTWRDIAARTGITVILLAWEMGVTAPATKLTKAMLALPNKLSERMPGMVGIVMHLTIESDRFKTRKLSVEEASALGVAKFRRDPNDKAAWSIPDDLYYRLGERPLVDLLDTIEKGVMFPTERYERVRKS